MKSKIIFLFILLFCSSMAQASYLRGLWVWNTSTIIGDSIETNKLINQCTVDGTTDIYLYVYGMLKKNKSSLQNFISKAQCNNINVWALDGYRGYFADWSGRAKYINFIKNVIAYNDSSANNQRFVGIHGDNEPNDGQGEPQPTFHNGIKGSLLDTLGGGVWQATEALDREYLMRDWISMTEEAYDSCHAHGIRYGQAMVSWLDDFYGEPVYCSYKGQYKRVLEHIMVYLDDYCIMSYNTNPTNAFNRVQGELIYAETLALGNRPRIWASCETHCGSGKNVSYCDTPGKNNKASVYSDLNTIESSCSAYSSYSGFNLHDWEGWQNLSPVSADSSNPECIPITSLNLTLINEKTEVYPNPGNGTITINNIHQNASIELLNMNGEIIYSEKAKDKTHIINIGEIPGIYLIKIRTENNIQTSKIVIE